MNMNMDMNNTICIHEDIRLFCNKCKGQALCKHDCLKVNCFKCPFIIRCNNSLCKTKFFPRMNELCPMCFKETDKNILINNYTLVKESTVIQFIKHELPMFHWISDKMEDSKNPDIFAIINNDSCVIVEIDEHRHFNYSTKYVNSRIKHFIDVFNKYNIYIVKFNPDAFIHPDTHSTTPSPWTFNKKGNIEINAKNRNHWNQRLLTLKNTIIQLVEKDREAKEKGRNNVNIIHLFYGFI